MKDMTGMKLGPYNLTRLVARGGMAEVYLAADTRDDQIYALKLVKEGNEDICRRFRHEATTLMSLPHPHILPILEYGSENNLCYYVMPYISYGTLKEHIARGVLHQQEAGKILIQVAEALHFLHTQGFVHRDIKASNILLDEKHYAWLADFGLVRKIEGGSDLTRTGCLMGTPAYMAPELGHTDATEQSDLYALGVVLYEMLTGQLPFDGTTPIDICCKHLYEQPPEPSLLNPYISPAIEEVVLRALAKDPGDRFASVQAMAEAYQEALQGKRSLAVSGVTLPKSEATIVVKRLRELKKAEPGWIQRIPLALGAAATIGLFAFALVSMGLTVHSDPANLAGNVVQAVAKPTATPTASPTPTPTPEPSASASQGPANGPDHANPGASNPAPQGPANGPANPGASNPGPQDPAPGPGHPVDDKAPKPREKPSAPGKGK